MKTCARIKHLNKSKFIDTIITSINPAWDLIVKLSCCTLTRCIFHICELIGINDLTDIIYSSYHCHHLHLQVAFHQGDLQPLKNLNDFILKPKSNPFMLM